MNLNNDQNNQVPTPSEPNTIAANIPPIFSPASEPISEPAQGHMSGAEPIPTSQNEPQNVPVEVAPAEISNPVSTPIIEQVATPISVPTTRTEELLNTELKKDPAKDALQKSQYFNDSIFWVEVEKIVPNPYQPRKEFDMHALKDLSESIRMYGLLQPLTVTRKEIIKPDGGLAVQYELISGERRLRASQLAGLAQVPVIIRAGEEDPRVKLELAIIENLQREDLNPVDRARSFQRLADEFGLKHHQIAEKMGKSREFVTNTMRILGLPAHMIEALNQKKITEGHTRPLLMLCERPAEQEVLFKEMLFRKMTVREAERIARGVAVERIRKHDQTPEYKDLEQQLKDALGTRVFIDKKEKGGKVIIDFFDINDVRHILEMISREHGEMVRQTQETIQKVQDAAPVVVKMSGPHAYDSVQDMMNELSVATPLEVVGVSGANSAPIESASAEKDLEAGKDIPESAQLVDDSTAADKKEDEDLYSVKGFSI